MGGIDFKKEIRERWKTILFVLSFALYLLTWNILFAALTLVFMLWLVFSEVKTGINRYGWKHEVVDTAVSIAIVLVFWFGLSFILNTPSPISAIVSCSMLPNLERGDMVLVQGTKAAAYGIEMTQDELEQLRSMDVDVLYNGKTATIKGSLYSYCMFHKDPVCDEFSLNPQDFRERKGPMVFEYSKCEMEKKGIIYQEPCLTSVEYRGKKYPINLSHDVIVYTPKEGTYFSYVGDIIHRAYFRIDSGGETYYLTKGDNNAVMDIQLYDYVHGLGNTFVDGRGYRGKLIFGVPYIGYLKLIISGLFDAPEQCSTLLTYVTA